MVHLRPILSNCTINSQRKSKVETLCSKEDFHKFSTIKIIAYLSRVDSSKISLLAPLTTCTSTSRVVMIQCCGHCGIISKYKVAMAKLYTPETQSQILTDIQ